jgi:hypothetical protein
MLSQSKSWERKEIIGEIVFNKRKTKGSDKCLSCNNCADRTGLFMNKE